MMKSKFSETQIVSILKQAAAGVPIKDLCRQAGISPATYYLWKSKYGGMEASDLRRVRELEAENAKLKRLYAELALDNAAMKDLIAKKRRADTKACGRRFWTFNLTDGFNRESVHTKIDTSITSNRLVRVFEQIRRERPLPQVLRTDNARSSSARASSSGPRSTAWRSSTSSPVSQTRTPISSASTAPTGRRCWISICSPGSRTCARPRDTS
jgi:putative transposase